MIQLTKNNTLEINGQTVILLDDRVKDGIWVDPEHLTEPEWQRQLISGWEDGTRDYCNNYPGHYRQVVRFKQPDRMELVTKAFNQTIGWHTISNTERWENGGHLVRQRFILKDQEQEPINDCFNERVDYEDEDQEQEASTPERGDLASEILRAADNYARLADPLNQTLEKQADIRMGFKAGAEWQSRQPLNQSELIEQIRKAMVDKMHDFHIIHTKTNTKKFAYWTGFGDCIVAFDNAVMDLSTPPQQ